MTFIWARINLWLSLIFSLVQLLPPERLNVTATEECDFLLDWKAGGGTNRNHLLESLPLDFEISYKRTWELWEVSIAIIIITYHYSGSVYIDNISGN